MSDLPLDAAMAIGLVVAAAVVVLPALAGRALTPRTARSRRASAPVSERLPPALVRRCAGLVVGAGAAVVSLAAPARATAPVEVAAASESGAQAPQQSARAAVPVTPHARVLPAGATYVVVRGDTLWDIARRHLPSGATDSEIARTWPRWYAANRRTIGADPGLIRPGMRLRVPDRRPTGTSASQHPSAATPRGVATSLDPDRR